MFLAQDNPLFSPAAQPFIRATEAKTLPGLFTERVRRTPLGLAYESYDETTRQWRAYTWAEMHRQVILWQSALVAFGLKAGDRVAIMLANSPLWVAFDMAAMGLDLVVVPLFANDRPDNAAWCIENAQARLVLLQDPGQKQALTRHRDLDCVKLYLSVEAVPDTDPNLTALADWLPEHSKRPLISGTMNPDALATICYTSGTTGHPKGVMLSHRNILWNADAGLRCAAISKQDRFLSFLPLSHMLERTVGYYLPMMSGASVSYARSIPLLGEDLQSRHPSVLISVPRIFERIHERIEQGLAQKSPLAQWLFNTAVNIGWQRFLHQQGRRDRSLSLVFWPVLKTLVADRVLARLGGEIRVCVCGGARLDPHIARTFIGLGVPLIQGYGLTEASPIVSVNRLNDNLPDSVGTPLPEVEIKLGEADELLIHSPGIMLGYWKNPRATAAIIDAEGWLHSGDLATLEQQHIHISGRSKDIIVLSTGEKVCPADIEAGLCRHPHIDQALVRGEGQSSLDALLVVNPGTRKDQQNDWLEIANQCLEAFPAYARINRLNLGHQPWTIENGLLTPTLKLKRRKILETWSDATAITRTAATPNG